MDIKEIRKLTGLSAQKFGDKYDIPLRTIQNWEGGVNTPPPYLVKLLERVVKEDLEQEPKWIPVSERLPEDVLGETSDDVLICVTDSLGESQTISTGFYGYYPNSKSDQGWWSMWAYGCSKISDNCKVLAWMPLPESCKVESED